MSRFRLGYSTRALQMGFVALLIVCTAQVAWWYLDQVTYTNQVRMMLLSAYQVDMAAAHELIEGGMPLDEVQGLFPYLAADETGHLTVNQQTMGVLDEARRRRLRRYGWEAGFFVAVLIGCIGVLWRALRAYDELQRRQQNFLAAVSHEFKSPLASLQLSTDSLGRKSITTERRALLVARMGSDLNRLESMITNILATSRLEDGEWHLYPEPIDLNTAVSRILSETAAKAQEKGVTLVADIEPGLTVLADVAALQSVLGNLVGNAIKATAAAGGGDVRVEAKAEQKQAIIGVVDTGVGFHKDEGPKLFDKFYRPGDEMRRQGGGTGLGLYIVRTLTELSGGGVTAISGGEGEGARFLVSWPLS